MCNNFDRKRNIAVHLSPVNEGQFPKCGASDRTEPTADAPSK